MNKSGGLILAILLFAFIFFGFGNKPKYQIGSCGSNNPIVLDTKTGEAWVVKDSSNGLKYLRPLHYEYKQHQPTKNVNCYTTQYYTTPEETRNNDNISWWTFIRRKFQKKEKDCLDGIDFTPFPLLPD